MTDTLGLCVEHIISEKKIKTVFQPIVSLRDGYVLGHEALSRITCESEIKNPDMLFEQASRINKLWELELLCRTTALESAFRFMVPPYSKKLFINVNPNIMHDESFIKGFTKSFLKQYKIEPNNIIFEITEKNVIEDMSGFRTTIKNYKSQDYKIAIDDAGAGYSGLNLISDVHPNYIKLDMNLIRGLDKDNIKYSLVKGMVELSKVSNISLIAEGVETYGELETLINLGVQYAQGYFIQRPDAEIKEIDREVLAEIRKINLKKNHTSQSMISNIYISNLCRNIKVVEPSETIIDAYNFMKDNPDALGLCVLEDEIPVGIITKEKMALKLSGYHGFSLYQNKAIDEIMDRMFLKVSHSTPVSMVSSLAMNRENNSLYDFIVVTKDDKYIGIVTIKDLLQKTTEIEISTAKHQNPLSGLPGNLVIEQKLRRCLDSEQQNSIIYFDIDNFKAYNDVYGFEKGDLIIKLLADILTNSTREEQFIGHIGGDDFIIILDHALEEGFCRGIETAFRNAIIPFYEDEDVLNGYIIAKNRHGQIESFPLMTLTCVLIEKQHQGFNNIYELTQMLSQLKKEAKARNHSCLKV